jgi:hypothetical protein
MSVLIAFVQRVHVYNVTVFTQHTVVCFAIIFFLICVETDSINSENRYSFKHSNV